MGSALDALRSIRLRFVAPLLLGAIMLFDSWDSIAIAYVMPSLIREWHLNPVSAGGLISAGYAGQFMGAMLLGSFAERYGRMTIFLVSVIWMGALSIGCALAPNYDWLFVLRLVQGVAIGGALPVSVTYINEIAPTPIRGRYFATFQFLAMSGYMAASLSSVVIIPNYGWRWLFACGALPLALLPAVILLLPESPHWLARRGRLVDAERALRKLGDRITVLAHLPPPPARPTGTVLQLPLLALFAPELRQRTIIVLTIWFCSAFANLGLATWVPSLYSGAFHMPVKQALRYSATASVLILPLLPTLALVIDRFGRRPFGIGGTAIATTALLTLGLTLPSNPMILVPLVISAQLTTSTVMVVNWPYTAETFPTQVRAVALGLGSSVARGASALTPILVGLVLNSGGSVGIVFTMFGTATAGALILWLTATRETARRRLDTI